MKCQRCIEGKEARYRVYSDVIDLKVCSRCAAEARSLRPTIELLDPDEARRGAAKGSSSNRGRGILFVVDSLGT
jgi:hypothetical protein